jgi:flagellar protein FliO/FliZ
MLALAALPLNLASGIALAAALSMVLSVLGLAAGTSAWGQAFPRTLDDVKIFGKGEAIEFVFSDQYDGQPIEEHKPGSASLNFSGIGSKLPVRDLRPRGESHYKQIKVVQNQYSTTVTFVFKDAAFSLKDRLNYSHEKNRLLVDVGQPGSAVPPSATVLRLPENQLLAEMEQKIAGVTPGSKPAAAPAASSAANPAPAPKLNGATAAPKDGANAPAAASSASPAAVTAGPLATGGMSENDFFVTLATMIGALAIIVLMLYGALYVYKRFLADRLTRFTGGIAFKQIASFAVGPRQRIVILEINGEMIACGVTPSQITFLTRLSGGAQQDPRRPAAAADAASEMPASITGLPAPGPATTEVAAAEPAKPDPVHQFAELLKQKVRSLKRIN